MNIERNDTLAQTATLTALRQCLSVAKTPHTLAEMMSERLKQHDAKKMPGAVHRFSLFTDEVWGFVGEEYHACRAEAMYFAGRNLKGRENAERKDSLLKRALEMERMLGKGAPSSLAGDCYLLLGNNASMGGDVYLAGQYYEWSKNQYLRAGQRKSSGFPMAVAAYTDYLIMNGNLDSALHYARLQYQLRMEISPEDGEKLFNGKIRLVSCFIAKRQMDSVRIHLADARRHVLAVEGDRREMWGDYYETASDLAERTGDWSMALNQMDSALQMGLPQGRSFAKRKINRADLQLMLGKGEGALRDAHDGMGLLLEKWSGENLGQLPSNNDLTHEPYLQSAFRCQGMAWARMALGQPDTAQIRYLGNALKCLSLACDMADTLRANFKSGGAKLGLTQRTYLQYEQGVEVCRRLHQLTGNVDYLERAWIFMERSKAMALLADLQANAVSQLRLPPELMRRERQLRDSLAHLESEGKNPAAYERINAETNAFREMLRDRYPAYYQFKYNIELNPLKNFRHVLASRQSSLLEYFAGDSALYVLHVTADSISLRKVDNSTGWPQMVERYRQALTGKRHFNSEAELLDTAHQLHELLIGTQFQDSTRILLVPDGSLWTLPFEALVTSPGDQLDLAQWLVLSHSVQYAYSVNMLHHLREMKLQGNGQLLAYAPLFQGDARWKRLDENIGEAKEIASLTGGTLRKGKAASEGRFRSEAGQYTVLHIASHAQMGLGAPDSTGIAFHSVEGDTLDSFLSVPELGGLRLNAELAVLSACETGDGRLVRGEGLMSLSRAFTHSGCRSLMMSLWSVDDGSTSTIMQEFYRGLSAGMEKDDALQQAKLKYIKTGNRHPNKWAAFVSIGASDSLQVQPKATNNTLWWVLAGITAIVLSVAGICRKGIRRKRTRF